jgi:NAD(P)-dependent dehydrogenase (short-subunit alcohol dehydrogenase family)
VTVELAGKRVVVTGASSGIGAELAVRMAAAGATVGLAARRAERLAGVLDACRRHSPGSTSWVCDLSDPAQVDGLAGRVLADLGGIDILVNNAGIPKRRHVLDLDPATVEAVMGVNFFAPVRLTLALLPHLVSQGSGLVVNVSSVAATLSSPGESAYDASKAALAAFSEAMAIDLWDRGVRVLVAYPGVVDTELFSIPGNEPLPASIDKIGVAELVDGLMAAIAGDDLQVYIPRWFKDVAASKAADVESYLAGAARWVRQQQAD